MGQYVEVHDDAGWIPGLLVAWERRSDGAWWDRVVIAVDGEASEFLRLGTALRPVR